MEKDKQIRAVIQELKIELEVEKLKAKVYEKIIVEGSATAEMRFSESFFNRHIETYQEIIKEQLKLDEQIKALESRLPENH